MKRIRAKRERDMIKIFNQGEAHQEVAMTTESNPAESDRTRSAHWSTGAMLAPIVLIALGAGCDANSGAEESVGAASAAIEYSPPNTIMKFSATAGFLDGVTCDTWPRDISITDSPDIESVLTDLGGPSNPATAAANWLAAEAADFAISSLSTIGSSEQLVVTSDDWRILGGPQTYAVDASRAVAYALSYEWLCTAQMLADGQCTVYSATTSDFGELSVLARRNAYQRSAGGQEPRQTVLLVAPAVRFVKSIELGVGLAVAADQIIGGAPLAQGEDLSARTGSVQVTVAPQAAPIASNWTADIMQSPFPGFLAFMANQMGGISGLTAANGVRIRSVEVVPSGGSGPTVDSSKKLTVPVDQFMSVTANTIAVGTMLVPWSEAKVTQYDPGNSNSSMTEIRREVIYPQTRTIDIAMPALRQTGQAGGVVFSAIGSGPGAILAAPGEPPITVEAMPANSSAMKSYAESLLGDLSVSCTNTTTYLPYSAFYDRNCDVLMKIIVNAGGKTYTIDNSAGPPTRDLENIYVSPMADQLADQLYAILQGLNGDPTASPGMTQDVRAKDSALLAGQVFSRGLLFDMLVHEADAESLATGVYSARYTGLAGLAQTLDPSKKGVYIAEEDRNRVERLARHLEIVGTDGVGALNALGLPYGKIAAGWYVPGATGTTGGPAAISDVIERWKDVGALVKDLQTKIELANGRADALALVGSSGSLTAFATRTEQVALKIKEAADGESVNGGKTIQRLNELFNDVQNTRNELEKAWIRDWNCQSQTMAGCAITIPAKVSALAAACPDVQNGEQWLIDLVSAAGKIVPIVSGAFSGVDMMKSAFEWMNSETWILSKISPDSMKKLGKIVDALKKVKDAAEFGKGVLEGLQSLEQQATPGCDRNSVQYVAMQSVLANVNLLKGQFDALDAQSDLLLLLMDSFMATIKTWSLISEANQELASGAQTLQSEAQALANDASNWQANQRKFVRAGCLTAQLAVRAAQSDLHHLSQMLQTSVGRATTTPYLTVPAYPASTTLPQVDDTQSFYLSLWDSSGFSSRFCADASCVTQSFAQKAKARFGELTSNQICGLGSTTLPKLRFVVRKVLVGQPLDAFKQTGRTDFSIDLNDVIAAGNALGQGPGGDTRLTSVAVGPDKTSLNLDLTSPVVLSVGYSGCKGSASNPCCSGSTCRTGLVSANPASLVGRGQHEVAEHCADPSKAKYAQTRVALLNKVAATCPALVPAPRFSVDLPLVDGTAQLPSLIQSAVDAPICNVITQNIQFAKGRGLPVMGPWTIAHNAQHGAFIENDLTVAPGSTTPEPLADAAWKQANAGLTGLEVLFFVGAEVRNPKQEPAYLLADADPAAVQYAKDILGFEAPSFWSPVGSPLTLASSAQVTQGAASLSVKGGGFIELAAPPLMTRDLPANATKVSYDLFIPTQQPNTYWVGASQMYITIPSANVHNAYLGQVELTALNRGAFNTLTFSLPGNVRTALARLRFDVSFKIALNINNGSGAYLLDNLRLN